MNELVGRTALISGGGRGIGRAIALAFGAEGARVAVAARTESEVSLVAEECRAWGSEALPIVLDVTDSASCHKATDTCLSRWGHLDVLVNNAGVASAHKFTDLNPDIWQRTLDVDLTGAFFLIREALPHMLHRHDGCVIAINSIAGKVGAPYIAAYNAAKHGLLGLMRSLAAEYARSGVTFNSVCPAYVDTPMTAGAIEHIVTTTGRSYETARQALLTPQGRLVRPEEVAAVCVLLASDAGRGINGQAINVDGGAVQW